MKTTTARILANKGLSAWISPDGEIFPCDYVGHDREAEKIIRERMIDIGVGKCADDVLVWLGWLRYSCAFGGYVSIIGGRDWYSITATQRQLDVLWDIGVARGRKTSAIDSFFPSIEAE